MLVDGLLFFTQDDKACVGRIITTDAMYRAPLLSTVLQSRRFHCGMIYEAARGRDRYP